MYVIFTHKREIKQYVSVNFTTHVKENQWTILQNKALRFKSLIVVKQFCSQYGLNFEVMQIEQVTSQSTPNVYKAKQVKEYVGFTL